MELQRNDLLILEESLNAKIAFHESEIEEIKNLEDSYYEEKLKSPSNSIINKFKVVPDTAEDLRNKDIQKELKEIEKINELKKKLFLSDSYLLLISNKVKLNISN